MPPKPPSARSPAADRPPSACLIYGEDDFLVARSARAIIDTICPPAEQVLGVEQVDGATETVDGAVAALRNCITAVRTPSFLGGRKVVWFRDVAFLKNDRLLKNEDVRRWLDELTGLVRDGLPAGQVLVLTAAEVDGRSAFIKAFKAAGRVIEHRRAEKSNEAAAQAEEIARAAFERLGVEADWAAVRELADRVGAEARTLAQEAEKLAAWAGERKRVEVEDVRRLTPATREAAGWALADAVVAGRAAPALRALRQLLEQSEDSIGLVSGLESRFRDLMILRDCADRGWVRKSGALAAWSDAPEAAAALSALGERDPRKLHPFRAGKLMDEASRFSPERLRAIRAAILDARERMVSGQAQPDLLLEFLVLRICGDHARPTTPA